jgi:nicotinate-nucleotide--dimethylbenzimidazole phosphoribosyltransferase
VEDFLSLANNIKSIDRGLVQLTQKRLDNLTKPLGSFGRLEEIAKLIVGLTGKKDIKLKSKVIFTLAADHGVTDEGVSPYPKEVTAQMVYNFLRGGAGINVLAKHVGARIVVADLGVAERIKTKNKNFYDRKVRLGTANMARGPAMTKEDAEKAINAGVEIFNAEYKKGIDIIGIGEMGIGNTTAASALTALFTKTKIEEVSGRGAGLDDAGLARKIEVIKRALEINSPDASDPVGVLAKVGGLEIAGLVGIIIASCGKRLPVVLDGFISSSAALTASFIKPQVKEYMIASHCSVEKGHKVILAHLGLKPLLDLSLRLGEGTGAALGINLVEASVKILQEMATFDSAGVSKKEA